MNRTVFNLKLKIAIFFHFLPGVFSGKISPRRFIVLMKRLLLFLFRMQHNKFVSIHGRTRLGLYVPGFPSRAFYTACHKFSRFGERMPCTTVLLSVTSACPYNCPHCYQKQDRGRDLDLEILKQTTAKLQEMGIAFFNIEGGEPFLVYDRLKSLCEVIDDRSEIWINSTGVGMTGERLAELKKLGVTAVMFSLHSHDPALFNTFMGKDTAWEAMEAGVRMCHEAGLGVAFNTCLLREDFYNGNFEKIMDKAKELGASIVQVIKPKPAGAWLARTDLGFSAEDLSYIKAKTIKYNLEAEFSHYPAVSAQILEEDKGVFGCTAGGTDRFYINAKGDLQPCEFLNISFGNIAIEDFGEIYQKMRSFFPWGGECFLCEESAAKIRDICREHSVTSLPLNPELSQKVYCSWNRGEKTDLYARLEKMK